MSIYLVLGNGPTGLSLLVAYSAIKQNAMAAATVAYPRYLAAPKIEPRLTYEANTSPRFSIGAAGGDY